MNIITRLALALLLAAGCYCAGWFTRTPEVVTKTNVEVQTVYRDRVQVQTKIVTIKETKPDGTVTETTTTEAKTDSKSSIKEKPVQVAQAVVRKDWSVGVVYRPDFRDPTWAPAGASVGYRVLGDLWIDGTMTVDAQPSFLLGVRYEF